MLVLELFGEISRWDNALENFSHQLKELREQYPMDTITLKINSHGGDPSVAWAIAHLIETDGNIDTMNIGLAASAAGFIFQKGRRRLSASNSMTMMHRSQIFVDGDCTELERVAGMLKQWDGEIIKVLVERTNIKDTAEVEKLLEKPGWWRNSDAALADGLIDEIVLNEVKQPLPKNSVEFITKNYSALPYDVLNQIITPTNVTEATMNPEEIKALCDGMAAAIVAGNQPLFDAITALIDIEKAEPAEPTDPAAVENATKALVNEAISPALTALNAASDALKASSDNIATVVSTLSTMPAQNNAGALGIYGVSGTDNSDTHVEKNFVG